MKNGTLSNLMPKGFYKLDNEINENGEMELEISDDYGMKYLKMNNSILVIRNGKEYVGMSNFDYESWRNNWKHSYEYFNGYGDIKLVRDIIIGEIVG